MVFDLPPTVLATCLAVLIAVVGMPHGGLDHMFGRALFHPSCGRLWPAVFFSSYLAVAAVVIAGWFVLPAFTVVMFFLISAWHFGDDTHVSQLANIVQGGMVIWIPLLFRPTEVAEVLACVIPGGVAASVASGIALTKPLLWAVGVFFVGNLGAERTIDAAGRKVAFALVFAGLPTLVSFPLYFCGWHSTRELAELSRQADPNHAWRGLRRVAIAAAPMALLATVITALVAWVFSGERTLEPVLVQAVFLGLSAVAVPHILLHVAVRLRGVNPFPVRIES